MAVLAPLVFGEALGSSLHRHSEGSQTDPAAGHRAGGCDDAPCRRCRGSAHRWSSHRDVLRTGAILAPTDAVAVAAAARRANLPPRVVTILEGESLVNDGTGLTALRVAVVAAAAGTVTVTEAGMILAESVVIGIGIGIICGFILVWVLRKVPI